MERVLRGQVLQSAPLSLGEEDLGYIAINE